jgi:DNA-binding CsgD family transcriptional regulator
MDQNKKREGNKSKLFVFCEKSTGTTQFRAESQFDADQTVERIAGLLAMQCLVRGYDPEDFSVLVPANEVLVERLQSRAKELLDEGRAVTPTTLSQRQSEILHSVIRNHANKEIASNLNITVRTVKFHISSLLNKFGVDNRFELARKAAGFLRHHVTVPENGADWASSNDARHRDMGSSTESLSTGAKESKMGFPGRALPA